MKRHSDTSSALVDAVSRNVNFYLEDIDWFLSDHSAKIDLLECISDLEYVIESWIEYFP